MLRDDDIVLCTVKSIQGTSVFLKIEDNEDYEGSMVFSEVAAGRIRNLRDYVSIGKKIVCKVLKVVKNHVELSFRRVTAKERDDMLEKYKKERALKNILKTAIEKSDEVLEKIKLEYEVIDFLEAVKEDAKVLEKFVGKSNVEKIAKIIKEKEGREKNVSSLFILSSDSENGLNDIKEILNIKDSKIHYLGSSKFSISFSGANFKEANLKKSEILKKISEAAKKKKANFEILN